MPDAVRVRLFILTGTAPKHVVDVSARRLYNPANGAVRTDAFQEAPVNTSVEVSRESCAFTRFSSR